MQTRPYNPWLEASMGLLCAGSEAFPADGHSAVGAPSTGRQRPQEPVAFAKALVAVTREGVQILTA